MASYGFICVTQLCPILCDPMDYIGHQAPLSMEFSRQEYWSGLPFPFPGGLRNPGIEHGSSALQGNSLQTEPQERLTGGSVVKNSRAKQEKRFQSLDW